MKARPRTEQSILKRQVIILIAAAGLSITALTIGFFSLARVGDAFGWVERTHHVIDRTRGAVYSLQVLESVHRAFLATGQNDLREQLESGIEETRERALRLRDAADKAAAQEVEIGELSDLILARLTALREDIDTRREWSPASAALTEFELIWTGGMEKVHVLSDAIVAHELRLLDLRAEDLKDVIRFSTLVIIACALIAFIIGGNSILVMRRVYRSAIRETELLLAKEKAEEEVDHRTEFFAHVSHEIRTPLNSIIGYSELLRNIVTGHKQRDYLEAIQSSGKSLLSIINDILDLSKTEAGRMEFKPEPVSIRSLVENVSLIFKQQVLDRRLKLVVSVDDGVPPALMIDPVRLRQILFNLVGNAIKFTPEGRIDVRVRALLDSVDGTRVTLELEVEDTGIGIAAEDHHLVFEPFRQVNDRRAAGGTGTGLGMSISSRLIRLMGGRLELESELGKGSKFTITFPEIALSPSLPAEEEEKSTNGLNTLKPSVILVVDHALANCELIAGYFADTHHRIVQASTVQEAVEVAEDFLPDLILMDTHLPELDGGEALREMRANEELKGIPIVAMTASSPDGRDPSGIEAFQGLLRKPISLSSLHAAFATLIPADEGVSPDRAAHPRERMLAEAATLGRADRRWIRMLDELRRLEREVVPDLGHSMGYRELERFGKQLLHLGREAGCSPLVNYSLLLKTEVADFRFDEQVALLNGFSELISILASRLESLQD